MDDTETMVLRVSFKAADNPGRYRVKDHLVEQRWEAVRVEPYGEYRQSDNPVLGYTIPRVISTEDATVMDSMGPIVDRENEIMLPVGDSGMRTLRAMYLEIVEDVRAGRDPLGTIRDPARNQCVEIPAYEYEIDAAERDRLLAAGVH